MAMPTELRVLYDGWPLIYQPTGNAALHLWELLTGRPAEVRPVLALPGPAPDWLPEAIECRVRPSTDTPGGRLIWEQFSLPWLTRQAKADLLHLTHLSAPLNSPVPLVLSPTAFNQESPAQAGLITRLRAALAAGGLARPRTLLWPQDLPDPQRLGPVTRLPFPPAWLPDSPASCSPGLPESYLLYHGPSDRPSLLHLMDIWSWASQPLGEEFPLLLLGIPAGQQAWLENQVSEQNLPVARCYYTPQNPREVLAVYQQASALLQPSDLAPWGDPVQRALSLGKPLIAAETAWADARVGPAGYLAPGDAPRSLGAAVISVIVEAGIASQLAQAAQKRVQGWNLADFGHALSQVYQTTKPW